MTHPHSATPHSADTPLAFPSSGNRPFPDPRPSGSAVSAASALQARLEAAEAGTLMATLGMEVLERSSERTVVRMPAEGSYQVSGILHGGASAALIETAASVAARCTATDDSTPVGTELHVSHLRPVSGGYITAIACPVHRGGRTSVYMVDVYDDAGHLTAHGSLRTLNTRASGRP